MHLTQVFKFLTLLLSGTLVHSSAFGEAPPCIVKVEEKTLPCTKIEEKTPLCTIRVKERTPPCTIRVVERTPPCEIKAQKGTRPCKPKPPEDQTPVSLQETLEHAYMQNAELDAARAGLRATDEDVSQAIGDWRPSLSVQGSQKLFQSYGSGAGHTSDTLYTASINQNVYKGGATIAAEGQAESNVLGARAGLFTKEQETLLSAIQAHTGIVSNEAIVRYQKDKETFTQKFLESAQARYEVGEGGRTDVAIAEGEYEGAKAEVSAAIARLESIKANYLRQVGSPPGKLSPAHLILDIPKCYEEALEVAKKRNPLIDQAKYALEAAEYVVDIQFAALLPNVGVNASVGNSRHVGTDVVLPAKKTNLAFEATVGVPIYLQGIPNSKVRQAYQRVAQKKIELVSARRQVVETVKTAWENLLAARNRVKSLVAAVKARKLAVEGAVEEFNVGVKSAIDVLLEQQKLTDSQIDLANAEQTLLVSSYQVLSAMGRLTAHDLKLKVRYYDPNAYYNEYKNAWIQFWQGEDLRYVKDEDLS